MLTRVPAPLGRRRRRAALLSAVAPTVRVAHLGLVALTVGLAAAPTLVTVAVGGDSYLFPSVMAGLFTGAAVGWAADDPAAELLGTMPTGSPVRASFRTAAALAVAVVGVVALLVVVALGPGLPVGVADRLPEAAAAGAAALAVGMVAARRSERSAGGAAVTAGALSTLFVTALSVKVTALPSFTSGPNHARWWLFALVALVVALHAGRDPARR